MDEAKERFNVWAPPDSRWAVWTKPVLFTVSTQPGSGAIQLPDVSSWQVATGDTAVIVNLPDAESVMYGLALASRGYRPVPLFNTINGPSAFLNVLPIAAALADGTSILQGTALAPDAPPAFLLDSKRFNGQPSEGQFDNRWAVFPQDLPSGVFLRSCGINRVIVVQSSGSLAQDLAPIFALWKRPGIELFGTGDTLQEPDQPINVSPVSSFGIFRTVVAANMIASLGLRRSMTGGFGGLYPTSGGG